MRLTRQFALLSLLVIALITAALSWVISQVLRADLLEREWSLTADYVRTEARQRLSPTDFATPWDATSQQHFQEFYRQAVMMPEIVRVKAVEDLGFPAEPPATPVSVKPDGAVQVDFSAGGIVLDDVERRLLWQALQAADWNRTRAAQLLGVSRDTLRYRIEKHGLRPPAGDPAG